MVNIAAAKHSKISIRSRQTFGTQVRRQRHESCWLINMFQAPFHDTGAPLMERIAPRRSTDSPRRRPEVCS
jgi:hypothetical protein